MAQAALLLSHWCPSSGHDDEKTNSTWLRVAIQHARAAGADCHPPNAVQHSCIDTLLGGNKQNILKRIWWCCVIRDRIIALYLRRGIQITQRNFDFVSNRALGFEDLSDETLSSRVFSANTKRDLITIVALMVELCVCLTDVLQLVYPLTDFALLGDEDSSRKLAKVRNSRKALLAWETKARRIFPRAVQSPDLPFETRPYEHAVILYTNLIWIYY